MLINSNNLVFFQWWSRA